MGEEDEVTTLGKVELPCNGRNISVRACKAAFRQKLGSIAVREFRPVICNCRAAHYNSPFLASELTPSPSPQPPPLLPLPTYPPTSRSVQRRVLAFVRFLAFSLSLSPLPVSLLPPLLRKRNFPANNNQPRDEEEEEEGEGNRREILLNF